MAIASLHIIIEDTYTNINIQSIVSNAKKVLHKHGIHSSTIQTELINSIEMVSFHLFIFLHILISLINQ